MDNRNTASATVSSAASMISLLCAGCRHGAFATSTGKISMISTETLWLAIGFLGQGLFFGRWLVQWFQSEREKDSTIPLSFWYFSLIGGLITLAYAVYSPDPVFTAGRSIGAFVYLL